MTTTTSTPTLTGTYAIDPVHSRIGFSARHAMVTKVRGSFNEFEGTGYFDAEDPSKIKLAVTIVAASIDTRNADRDEHLRGNDFLDMATHPTLAFTSTSVEKVGDATYRVVGDLTLKGVTKPVTIDFQYEGSATDAFGSQRIGFEGSTTISRKEWGVTWNMALEAGGVAVSDKVTLEFEVSAVKSQA